MKKKFLYVLIGVVLIVVSVLYVRPNKRVTKDDVIKTFNDNQDLFNQVKIYCLRQNKEFVLTPSNYTQIIEKEDYKDIERIFDELDYIMIHVREDTVTFEHSGNGWEDMCIIYSSLEREKYGQVSEKLGDGWYYYWIGYDKPD